MQHKEGRVQTIYTLLVAGFRGYEDGGKEEGLETSILGQRLLLCNAYCKSYFY